jgi:hypothetical protein
LPSSTSTPLHPDPRRLRLAMPRGSPPRRRALSNAWGLDVTSPLRVEAHVQDLWFRRHQQHTCKRYDNPNNARGLYIAHLLSSTLSASTSTAPTMPHPIKAKYFSIKSKEKNSTLKCCYSVAIAYIGDARYVMRFSMLWRYTCI